MVSTLDFESKEPSATLGKNFSELIFDAADYSWK